MRANWIAKDAVQPKNVKSFHLWTGLWRPLLVSSDLRRITECNWGGRTRREIIPVKGYFKPTLSTLSVGGNQSKSTMFARKLTDLKPRFYTLWHFLSRSHRHAGSTLYINTTWQSCWDNKLYLIFAGVFSQEYYAAFIPPYLNFNESGAWK